MSVPASIWTLIPGDTDVRKFSVRLRTVRLKLSVYSSDTPASGWNSKSWTGRAAGGGGTGNTISGREGIVGAGGVRRLKSAAEGGVVVPVV